MRMDKGCRIWLVNTARKHYWRVSRWYDLADLIQDGQMCYYKVVAKYPEIREKRHIMRLFQRTFLNYIHDLSKKRTRTDPIDFPLVLPETGEPDTSLDLLMGPDHGIDQCSIAVAGAPVEVRKVLELFSSEDTLRRLRSLYRIKDKGQRETTNARLARLTGLPEGTPFDTIFKEYFAS